MFELETRTVPWFCRVQPLFLLIGVGGGGVAIWPCSTASACAPPSTIHV